MCAPPTARGKGVCSSHSKGEGCVLLPQQGGVCAPPTARGRGVCSSHSKGEGRVLLPQQGGGGCAPPTAMERGVCSSHSNTRVSKILAAMKRYKMPRYLNFRHSRFVWEEHTPSPSPLLWDKQTSLPLRRAS